MSIVKHVLFEYCAVWNPTKEELKEGKEATIVVEPATLLAQDQSEASFKVARLIPEEYAKNPKQVEISVRPF